MRLILLPALMLLPLAAQAHGLHDHAGGWLAGLVHPLLGLDHLLAALAVGLWAGAASGPARLGLPLAFAVTLLLTAGLGQGSLGAGTDWIEAGIAGSLLALGLLLLLRATPQPWLAAPLLVLLAVTHGLAHGAEGPAESFVAYLAGLGLATLGLHAAGLVMVRVLPGLVTRLAGGLVLGAGLASML